MNIVLYQPEIPYNTGNIGRTCVATNTKLHLIKPLGFKVTDRAIKRAGLDYWDNINVTYYDDYDDFIKTNNNKIIYMCTTKARKVYTDVRFDDDNFIMFGSESSGIPEEILLDNEEFCIRIPMIKDFRSLNLSNATSIILYEALRQMDFCNMNLKGNLHKYDWNH